MDGVRIALVALAGIATISAPFVLYAGEVYCKLHHIEAPKMDSFLLGAIGGITTILYFAFRRSKDDDEGEP